MVPPSNRRGEANPQLGRNRLRGSDARRGIHSYLQQVEPRRREEGLPVPDVPSGRDHVAAARGHDIRELGEPHRAAPLHVHTQRARGRVARARHLQPLSQARSADSDARHSAHDCHLARPRPQRCQQVFANSSLFVQFD